MEKCNLLVYLNFKINKMYREQVQQLINWKNSSARKPLLIKGARQVGKTWLMKSFGESEYENCIYVNFESNKRLQNIFTDDFDIKRIITALEVETGKSITSKSTLIILDEIQEANGALTALKYFYENAPEFHIISAGSLLGVALSKQTSFPVGKVDFLNLYPLSFPEFLEAINERPLLKLLKSKDWKLITAFKSKYIQLLKQYYFIGGMPEVVSTFAKNKDFAEARDLQNKILQAYELDFSKHAPNEIVPRIRMLWNSIPSQLAKENKKFIYGAIKSGARAKEYELALAWLIDCGLIHQIKRVTKPAIPLKAYEDFTAFKLFLVDVGLLVAMSNVDAKSIIDGNALFQEFKGALTEQYVLQQLLINPQLSIYYWAAENATAEIDFLIQNEGKLTPIEVKAEENLKAKSLKLFYDKFKVEKAIRTSMSDYREEDWLINLPLYAIGELR